MELTLREFGDLLGVSDTSVRRWEHGNCQISRKNTRDLKIISNQQVSLLFYLLVGIKVSFFHQNLYSTFLFLIKQVHFVI